MIFSRPLAVHGSPSRLNARLAARCVLLMAAILLAASPVHAEKKKGAGKPKKAKAEVVPSQLAQPVKETSEVKAKSPFADDDFGKLPTYIKADSLTVKNQERIFVYTGNVEVTHGDLILTSNSIEGNYDENNQIKDLKAHENVTIVKGEDIRATGEQAVYDKATDTLILTDSPELQQNGSVLTADRVLIFLKENRSVAEGQVRVRLIKPASSGDEHEKKSGLDVLRK